MRSGVCILCKSDKGAQIRDEYFFVCFDCIDRVTDKKREYVKPPEPPRSEGLSDLREFVDLHWGIWPGREAEVPRYTKV